MLSKKTLEEITENLSAFLYRETRVNTAGRRTEVLNRRDSEAMAQSAVWLASKENPEASSKEILKIAHNLAREWIRKELQEEKRQSKYDGANIISFEESRQALVEETSPDTLLEKKEHSLEVLDILDRAMIKWGPHAMGWFAMYLSQDLGIQELLCELGYPREQAYSNEAKALGMQISRTIERIKRDGQEKAQSNT